MLQLENVEFQYEDGFHLYPINVSLSAGNFIALIGPNGSGKTSLFSLITGFIKPKKGKILYKGQDISTLKDKERAKLIGTVSQTNKIYFNHKVEDLIAMGRYPHRSLFSKESSRDKKIIEDVIIRLELETYKKRFIKSLSGGEYQRVLIAMALVQQTPVILLDEPGNHLDLKHQTVLLRILKEEVLRGKMIIAVLHDINQALFYADNCLLLNNGKTVAFGSPFNVLTTDIVGKVFDTELTRYYNNSGKCILGPADCDH